MIRDNQSSIVYSDAAAKMDAIIAQKYRLRELAQQFAAEDRHEFERRLANARRLAGEDETLQSLLTWLAILSPLGPHATFIVQAWTGWQYRQNHAPNVIP